MDEMKLFCKENMISWVPKGDGVISCVKISPVKEETKFYSFTIFSKESKWAVSVWLDNGTKKNLKLYLDDSCSLEIIEAAKFSLSTFENI